jgi:nucleotide-binding universal stress UspA family protein
MRGVAGQGEFMFKHVLIATDGSELATKALHAGLGLAKSLGAKVTAIAITEPRTNLVPDKTAKSARADEYDAALANAAQAVLTNAEAEARKLGVSCATVHVANEFPAEGILKEAKTRGCDVIVMASHGRRGLARLLLGGETLRVVTHSPIPVLVCR